MSVFSSTAKTNSSNYQPGVDGLRAVAVMLVLLFHVGFSQVSGGFVGVDVFFVISGYLITGIIFNAASENRFSYVGFMGARIARLYPALIFTLIVTFIFCFLLYSPSDFTRVAKSGLYALASASNIYFSNSAGYFDTSQETNPLLHTWSLAVEQQFYLIWPILIVASVKFAKKITGLVIAVIAIISLIASQWAITNMQVEAYYLMPFRVFELGFGGVAFFISKKVKLSEKYKEIMMFAGLLMIVIPAFTYSSMTPFPGINAMLPVAGAVLCILSHDAKYCGFVINNRASVGVGIISYSVYLIHWPIIIFFKYWSFRDFSFYEKLSIIFSSLIAGYFMYILIENRFRKIKIYCPISSSSFFYLSIACVLSLYIYTIKDNGITWRVGSNNLASSVKEPAFGGDGIEMGKMVVLGDVKAKPEFVIMGDSYARQYSSTIDRIMRSEGRSAIGFFADGSYLSPDILFDSKGKLSVYGKKVALMAINYAKDHSLPIVYVQSWLNYRTNLVDENRNHFSLNNDNVYMEFHARNIEKMKKMAGTQFVIIGNHPTSGGEDSDGGLSCVNRPSYVYTPCANKLFNRDTGPRRDANNYLKSLMEKQNIQFIDPYIYLCKNGKCSSVSDDGNLIHSDAYHLSKTGASVAWKGIGPEIDRILKLNN